MPVLTLSCTAHGLARLTLDQPGEPANRLTAVVLAELEARLAELAARPGVRALVIASAKPDSFLVGGDVADLLHRRDRLAAAEYARLGQQVLAKLAALPFPSVAVIDGACLAGGLDLALACTYRLATDRPATQLGHPEAKLGLIPSWGGTQRLPRLIGLLDALLLIATGRAVDGPEAARLGLVDDCVPAAFLPEEEAAFLARLEDPAERAAIVARRPVHRPWRRRLMDRALTRRAIMEYARYVVLEETGGRYPAPLAALRVTRRGLDLPLDQGLELEATSFGELAVAPLAKHQLRLLLAADQLRHEPLPAAASPRPVRQAAVIGAGTMGGGLAWLCSEHGLPVRLKDISWDAIGQGTGRAARLFARRAPGYRLTPGEQAVRLQRLSGTTDYRGLRQVDLALEAVTEEIATKRAVYAELERVLPPDAILATNSSALPIDLLAAGLAHPERFLGLHFFNPVHRMALVEVIPGSATRPEVVATCLALLRGWGKQPMIVRSAPGFLVNRLLLPYLNEALVLLQEGTPPEALDRALTEFGLPLGPLALLDEIGLDVAHRIATLLAAAYEPRQPVAPLLAELTIVHGLLGRKGGYGFYRHGSRTQLNPDLDGMLADFARRHGRIERPSDGEAILERCLLPMINEAARCLEEQIVPTPERLDLALVLGIGFPAFRGGLLRYADEFGPRHLVDRLHDLAKRHGPRYTPCDRLLRMAKLGASFHSPPPPAATVPG